MKPTLFVLAAGMGSRYGGLKQLDGLGPNGETIMDYSIYDAIRGGFGKVVFVIRKDFEKDFREKILSKYENHIPVELVFQALDNLPEGFTCPADRVKPWGTNHAVLMGKDVIKEPFAVINADDFYGHDSFAVLGAALSEMDGKKNDYCMVDNLFTGIHILIWMVGLGTLLAGAIGVSNIMMVTVKERTTEIGIRRAIGARPKDILQQILSESMVLTTIAGMFGISFAVMVLQLVEMGANSNGGDAHFQVSFGLAVGTCALLIALGMLAGLAPAYRAMAIKPIEAIRDE